MKATTECIASLYCQFKRFQRRVYFEHLFRICYVANTGLYLGLNDVDQSRFRGNWDFAKKGRKKTEKWLDDTRFLSTGLEPQWKSTNGAEKFQIKCKRWKSAAFDFFSHSFLNNYRSVRKSGEKWHFLGHFSLLLICLLQKFKQYKNLEFLAFDIVWYFILLLRFST